MESNTPADPVQTHPPVQPSKSSGILPVLIILVILLLGGTAFLAYQNMQLTKQVAKLSKITPSPIPTVTLTPNQLITDKSGWVTFTNPTLHYTFSFQQNPQLVPINCTQGSAYEKSDGDIFAFDASNSGTLPSRCSSSQQSWPISITPASSAIVCGQTDKNWQRTKTTIKVDNKDTIACESVYIGPRLPDGSMSDGSTGYMKSTSVEVNNTFFNFILNQKKYTNTFDQILSTFSNSTSVAITKEKAVQLVRSLGEVQKYLLTVPKAVIEVDHENDDKTSWVVHVYEMLSDHTATYNWFDVNKQTGQITKMFNF